MVCAYFYSITVEFASSFLIYLHFFEWQHPLATVSKSDDLITRAYAFLHITMDFMDSIKMETIELVVSDAITFLLSKPTHDKHTAADAPESQQVGFWGPVDASVCYLAFCHLTI